MLGPALVLVVVLVVLVGMPGLIGVLLEEFVLGNTVLVLELLPLEMDLIVLREELVLGMVLELQDVLHHPHLLSYHTSW